MNSFAAFRSAAAAVLRQQRPTLWSSSSVVKACLRAPASAKFHSTPIALKKKAEMELQTERRKIEVPAYTPTPKPRRGKKIGIPWVHLLDTSTNTPGPLRPLVDILESVNEEEFYVELVTQNPPVVKLVDVKESRAMTLLERQRAKRGAGQRDMHKEVQLTWSMTESDEAHKLAKAREDLEKGYHVDLVYSPKKGAKPPPHIEIQFKLKEVLQKFESVAKESRSPTIEKKSGALHLQPKAKISMKIDREQLKESVPKSVLEHQKALERERQRLAAERREKAASLEDSYQNLWGA